jgi:signal transduction histidine kinase
MRALIFELRPESLEREGLVVALGRQVAAMRARHGIDVQADLGDEPEQPIEVKQSLYRIAQEALHNTLKHAQASRINLRLTASSDDVVLEVLDNGVGFDSGASFPGHLGLRSMRERVAGLGGTLTVDSSPAGTHISARIPIRASG